MVPFAYVVSQIAAAEEKLEPLLASGYKLVRKHLVSRRVESLRLLTVELEKDGKISILHWNPQIREFSSTPF